MYKVDTFPRHWLLPKNLLEAKSAQQEMAEHVLLQDHLPEIVETIAGVDVSNTPFDSKKMVFGSTILLSYPSLKVKESATQATREEFPYISGFLGFREIPTLIQTFRKLSERPHLILVDGHGTSHPRGLGIASHLGVLLDLPTIGVAKSILIGRACAPLPTEVGSMISLEWQGMEIGVCLRTKKGSLPLIISPGHKITLQSAVQWVVRCLKGYRLPEPTRHAHLAANVCRKSYD